MSLAPAASTTFGPNSMAVDVVFMVDMGQEANQTYQDVKMIRKLEKNGGFSVFAIHENRHDAVEHRRFRC